VRNSDYSELKNILHIPELLLVEYTTHAFMLHVYATIKTIGFYSKSDFNPWDPVSLEKETSVLFKFCKNQNIQNILFITASPYYFIFSKEKLDILKNTGIHLSAILHGDVPREPSNIANLVTISNIFDNLFVYHEECIPSYSHIPLSKPLKVIPHPPSLLSSFIHYPRIKRSIKDRKIVLGFLGEIRHGKGFLSCVRMLAELPFDLREKFSCLFAGGATIPEDLESIKNILIKNNIESKYITGETRDDYRAISDLDFIEATLQTDVVMFPYEYPPATDAFSGAFIDSLMAGSVCVATENSVMGRIITKEKLGYSFSMGDQQSLIIALTKAFYFLQSDDIVMNQKRFFDRYFNGPLETIAARACIPSFQNKVEN
jgi:hypothetical protein